MKFSWTKAMFPVISGTLGNRSIQVGKQLTHWRVPVSWLQLVQRGNCCPYSQIFSSLREEASSTAAPASRADTWCILSQRTCDSNISTLTFIIIIIRSKQHVHKLQTKNTFNAETANYLIRPWCNPREQWVLNENSRKHLHSWDKVVPSSTEVCLKNITYVLQITSNWCCQYKTISNSLHNILYILYIGIIIRTADYSINLKLLYINFYSN